MLDHTIRSWRQGVPEFLKNDVTFRLRSSYYKDHAIFKKTTSNTVGSFAIPKAEAEALDLNLNNTIDVVAFRLNFNERIKFRAREIRKDDRGFFSFTFPRDKADENDIPLEDLAPVAFVASKTSPGPGIIDSIQNLIQRNSRYNAGRAMLWKQRVKVTEDGRSYITIEPNERDYFNIEPGDNINITTLPLEGPKNFNVRNLFRNYGYNTIVRDNAVGDASSVRVYIGDLVRAIGYDEGTLVQCIAVPG